ncbi:MAG TPA: hypothetical protein VMF69_22045 [Gemmataceae bacterium]|nr:hypothetical protein [Gemmataceae bacterium]
MRMSKASIILVMVPLVVAASDDKTPPKGFREVTPTNRAWVAWYPSGGKLRESEELVVLPRFGQIRVFRNVLERKDTSLFAVSQVRLPPKFFRSTAKARQDFFVAVACNEFNAQIKEQKNIKLGTMAGKEFLLAGRGNMVRTRIYETGAQVFRVTMVGTKKQVSSEEAETFFTSFKRASKTSADKKDKQ